MDAGVPDAGPPDAGNPFVPHDAGRFDAGATPLPCDVDAILATHCRICHSAPPANFAPMSLVTWEDTQRPAPTMPCEPVWALMRANITANPPTMPPRPNAPLSTAETGTILAWIDAGTPAGTRDAACPSP